MAALNEGVLEWQSVEAGEVCLKSGFGVNFEQRLAARVHKVRVLKPSTRLSEASLLIKHYEGIVAVACRAM